MKNAIVLMAMFLSAGLAHGKTVCNVNTSSQKTMEFDKILASTEVSSPKYFILKKGSGAAEEVDVGTLNTKQKWQAVDGATMIVFAQQAQGHYSISIGRVNAADEENLYAIEAMTSGEIRENGFLNLLSPRKNLSVICFNLP